MTPLAAGPAAWCRGRLAAGAPEAAEALTAAGSRAPPAVVTSVATSFESSSTYMGLTTFLR
eukprot:355988-Prymnesium_polylepis.1